MEEKKPKNIGILAYGSLVDDQGAELAPLVNGRIPCQTPFNVEYARLSRTRDMAPTVIPTTEGAPVSAVVLVLAGTVTEEEATSMLWRRETGRVGKAKKYVQPEAGSRDSVAIERVENFEGVGVVLYTSIPSNTGIMNTPGRLANFAIESALGAAGDSGRDGITYLANNIKNGIITPLTKEYKQQILAQTGTKDLAAAKSRLDPLRPAYIRRKEDWKAFEAEVRVIADLIFASGIKATVPDTINDGQAAMAHMKANYEEFIIACHTGFKEGQTRILTLIMALQEERKQNKAALKVAHSSRNKDRVSRLKEEAKEMDHKEKVLRHLMDGIVWQLMGGQLYAARQLYKEVEDTKVLSSSNVESVIKAAAQINEDPLAFALITDLTSYVQIGDLLVVQDGHIGVAEVKEGEKNAKNYEIINSLGDEKITAAELAAKHQLDEKDMEQLKRQFRQLVEMENFTHIMNHDKGLDLPTGKKFTILTPQEPTPYFTDRLSKLEDQLKERNYWAYDVIDTCLHIGIYKGPFRHEGARLLKDIAEQSGARHIVINYVQVLESLNKPIVNLPFTTDFIFDILFGRVIVYMMLDLDKYMELAGEVGLHAEWATRKQTARVKDQMGQKGLFLLDNQAVRITFRAPQEMVASKDMGIWLSGGVLSKIFFEHIMPSYTLYSYWYYFEMLAGSDLKDSEDATGQGKNPT
jgi:hypothetical protein